jgi:hypothetical protein
MVPYQAELFASYCCAGRNEQVACQAVNFSSSWQGASIERTDFNPKGSKIEKAVQLLLGLTLLRI